MSNSVAEETKDNTKRNLDKFSKARQRKASTGVSELTEFRSWLNGLGYQSEPKIHVNGVAYTIAVMVVDFGTPLVESIKLTTEQTAELIGHIRSATKSLYRDREVSVRVQSDTSTGIWWSSIG